MPLFDTPFSLPPSSSMRIHPASHVLARDDLTLLSRLLVDLRCGQLLSVMGAVGLQKAAIDLRHLTCVAVAFLLQCSLSAMMTAEFAYCM